MHEFMSGPFTFTPGGARRVAGVESMRWSMHYGAEFLAEMTLPAGNTQDQVAGGFGEHSHAFVARAKAQDSACEVQLIDEQTGEKIASFLSHDNCGMTAGLIDDRSRYWIRSPDRLYSRAVTLGEYAQVVAQHEAPQLSWIASLLPAGVLTSDPADWRAPTSWEIRHVVGEGSFTRMSGAKAASLVGITPQNFRKYTARDGATTRQNISFAAWHLLLHKLGVKRA